MIFVGAVLTASAQTADCQMYAVGFASGAHPVPVLYMADKAPATDSVNMARDVRYIMPGHYAKVFSLFPRVTGGLVEIKQASL